jgi:hypothetical protein
MVLSFRWARTASSSDAGRIQFSKSFRCVQAPSGNRSAKATHANNSISMPNATQKVAEVEVQEEVEKEEKEEGRVRPSVL